MGWIIFFLHLTRDNTTVSLSYVYGLIVGLRREKNCLLQAT